MKAIGALLAGGQSRRMGADKALLPVGAGTLLDHMLAKLRALDLAEVVVCRDAPGCIADRIPGRAHSARCALPGHPLPRSRPADSARRYAAARCRHACGPARREQRSAAAAPLRGLSAAAVAAAFPRSDPRDRNAGDRSRRRSLACRAAARTGRGNTAAAPAGNRICHRQHADGVGAHRAEADRALLIAERRSPGVCENQNAAPDNAH
ncbi:MAG: NTP transferase domain-containing protein [Gammaproteobacteria bacterium]|nr:NTP transferase domain-containing protein [Gammaproteobacteria bacterium]